MSNNLTKSPIVIIGAGNMAMEYVKVLKSLSQNVVVVGRSQTSASFFTEKTGFFVYEGGISKNKKILVGCKTAIIAVNIDQLFDVALQLLELEFKKILIEKPAALNSEQIHRLEKAAQLYNAKVYVAYNRRFYSSVQTAKQMIQKDGGVTSFHFEFTEWSHQIKDLNKPEEVFHQWFLGNSSHVVDLAFFLGGVPKEIQSYVSGSLPWHPNGSIFAGAGMTEKGALFSYQANWEAPGRWGVEILTKKHRYIFRPLEQLHIQEIGSVLINKVNLNDEKDQLFKPGLYNQTVAFLYNPETSDLLPIEVHDHVVRTVYSKMVKRKI